MIVEACCAVVWKAGVQRAELGCIHISRFEPLCIRQAAMRTQAPMNLFGDQQSHAWLTRRSAAEYVVVPSAAVWHAVLLE